MGGHFVRIRALRLTLVVAAVFTLQVVVLGRLHIVGVHPDLVWLLPMATGLLGGSMYGAVTGFAIGLSWDLFVTTPFGLSALVACLIGAIVGRAAERGLDARMTPAVIGVGALCGAGASVAYPLLSLLLGTSQYLRVPIVDIVVVVAAFDSIAAPAVVAMVRRGIGPEGVGLSSKASATW